MITLARQGGTGARMNLRSGLTGIAVLALALWLPSRGWALLDFPSGLPIVVDGAINTWTAEWVDAGYTTITVNLQPADCWYKFAPAINCLLFGFRVQDATGPSTQDQITIFFDNSNDGLPPLNYGFGLRRSSQLREYIDTIELAHGSPWTAALVDDGTSYTMEFSIQLSSLNFLFEPGFNPNGPAFLIQVKDNASLNYYPAAAGAPDAYAAYEDIFSSYWWLSSPPPTRTPTPTVTPTPTITPTPLPGIEPALDNPAIPVVYPNPASGPAVTFAFYSAGDARAEVRIFNTALKHVATLRTQALAGRINQVAWELAGIAPGIYLYEIQVGGQKLKISKLAVVK